MGNLLVLTDCKKCGGPRIRNHRGVLTCNPCATRVLNARRERLRSQSLCLTCGQKPVESPHSYCADCRERKRLNGKKQRDGRPAHSCKNCGIPLPSTQFRHCSNCLDKFRKARAKARRSGICSGCRKVPVTPGYSSCERCREVRRVLRRTKAENGICGYGSDCPNPNAKGKLWCEWHLKRNSRRNSEKRRADRELVIKRYGGACACCGETEYEFLAIDHVHGGGAKEIKQTPLLAKVVIQEGFPDRFRLLCHNCNMARGLYGYCPHEKAAQELFAVG